MIRASSLALLLMAGLAQAQSVKEAPRAELRWLDKVSGATADVEMARGQSAAWCRLTIQLNSCRYPVDNASGEAYANLTIRDSLQTEPVFNGWMVASAPALSALDHARYDVWVLRCLTE